MHTTDIDRTFAVQRLEKIEVEDANYKHCTFINVGFKEVKFKNSEFFNCIFVGCYFRRTQFFNCSFLGCNFIDCKFPYISINSCDFRYSNFRDCQILFSEIKHSLPSEPNLREDLSRNLALESQKLGLHQEAKRYKTIRMNAHEEHLKAAFFGESTWYQEHFDMIARTRAFFEWLISRVNGCLWGYGEDIFILIRNLAIVLILFPLLFFLCSGELEHKSGHTITSQDIFYFSLENILPAGVVSGVTATGRITQLLAGLESFIGVLLTALFAMYIFRWSLQR